MSDRFATTQEAVQYIETAYNRRGNYLVDGVPRYQAHAVRMEEKTGMTGIAGRYKFLEGKEPAFAEYDYRKKYQKYSIVASFLESEDAIKRSAGQMYESQMPEALKNLNQEIADLTVLNPELKALNYNKNNLIETYRALIGVTSQYNVDDVNAYLHSVRTGSKNKEVVERVENLTKKTGVRFGWQPSSKTVDKIEKYMMTKELLQNKAKTR